MKRKKTPFMNLFDLLFILAAAALAAVIVLFVSPTGRTVEADCKFAVSEGNVDTLSEGDVLTALSGGCIGKVTKAGDGYLEVSVKAEYHAGRYYSGAVALKDGAEYVVCAGADKFVCTLTEITKR